MKVGLTFACINLKKLARMKKRKGLLASPVGSYLENLIRNLICLIKKRIPPMAFAC